IAILENAESEKLHTCGPFVSLLARPVRGSNGGRFGMLLPQMRRECGGRGISFFGTQTPTGRDLAVLCSVGRRRKQRVSEKRSGPRELGVGFKAAAVGEGHA